MSYWPAQRFWWHDFDRAMRFGVPGCRIEQCGCQACADREAKYDMVDWPNEPLLAGPWRERQK